MKGEYNQYLINRIDSIIDKYIYIDNKKEKRLKSMIIEIKSTNDENELNKIGEELEYLLHLIKHSV